MCVWLWTCGRNCRRFSLSKDTSCFLTVAYQLQPPDLIFGVKSWIKERSQKRLWEYTGETKKTKNKNMSIVLWSRASSYSPGPKLHPQSLASKALIWCYGVSHMFKNGYSMYNHTPRLGRSGFPRNFRCSIPNWPRDKRQLVTYHRSIKVFQKVCKMKFGELFIVIYQHRLSSVMIFVIHTKNFDHIFFFFFFHTCAPEHEQSF